MNENGLAFEQKNLHVVDFSLCASKAITAESSFLTVLDRWEKALMFMMSSYTRSMSSSVRFSGLQMQNNGERIEVYLFAAVNNNNNNK